MVKNNKSNIIDDISTLTHVEQINADFTKLLKTLRNGSLNHFDNKVNEGKPTKKYYTSKFNL